MSSWFISICLEEQRQQQWTFSQLLAALTQLACNLSTQYSRIRMPSFNWFLPAGAELIIIIIITTYNRCNRPIRFYYISQPHRILMPSALWCENNSDLIDGFVYEFEHDVCVWVCVALQIAWFINWFIFTDLSFNCNRHIQFQVDSLSSLRWI